MEIKNALDLDDFRQHTCEECRWRERILIWDKYNNKYSNKPACRLKGHLLAGEQPSRACPDFVWTEKDMDY